MYECDIPHKAYFVTALIKSEYYDICSFMHPIKMDMFLILPSVLIGAQNTTRHRDYHPLSRLCAIYKEIHL